MWCQVGSGERKKWDVLDDGCINSIRGQGWLLPNTLCLWKKGNSTVWMSMSKCERETGTLSRDTKQGGTESAEGLTALHTAWVTLSKQTPRSHLSTVGGLQDWADLTWRGFAHLFFSHPGWFLPHPLLLCFISTSLSPRLRSPPPSMSDSESVCGWALECAKIVTSRNWQVGPRPRGCLTMTAHSPHHIGNVGGIAPCLPGAWIQTEMASSSLNSSSWCLPGHHVQQQSSSSG